MKITNKEFIVFDNIAVIKMINLVIAVLIAIA